MKILLGNNHLHTLGGTETYTYTLASALQNLGHEVEVMLGNQGRTGLMSERIHTELGINVESLTGGYDAVLLNHNTTVFRYFHLNRPLRRIFLKGLNSSAKVVQIIHGTIPKVEHPYVAKRIEYVAISDEVRDFIEKEFCLNSTVIPNLIDCEAFHKSSISTKCKSVYSLSQSTEFNELLATICSELNLEFSSNDKYVNPVHEVNSRMSQADLVFSLGRGCYEAMAMGKNVIVADMRSYMNPVMDGMVTKENFELFRTHNCSGRATSRELSKATLIREIMKYDQSQGEWNRQKILEEQSSGVIANQLLSLF